MNRQVYRFVITELTPASIGTESIALAIQEPTMPDHPNAVLRRLESGLFEQLMMHSETLDLRQGLVLAETREPVTRAYFPHIGVISNVVELVGGGAIKIGMVGRDGVFGAAQALDHHLSLNHVVIQVAVKATVVEGSHVAALAARYPELRRLLLAYEQFTYAQAQQTAACNAVHRVPERLCKWLLRMQDLTGNELPLTQEFLAQMIGVRRTSVTAVAVELADAGLISYSRGRVHILNVKGLRARSCECHDEIKLNYQRMFARL